MANTTKRYLDYDGLKHLLSSYIVGQPRHGKFKGNELTTKIEHILIDLVTLSSDPYDIDENMGYLYAELQYGYNITTNNTQQFVPMGTVYIPNVTKDNFLKLDSADINNGVLQLYLDSNGRADNQVDGSMGFTDSIDVKLTDYFNPDDYYTISNMSNIFITTNSMSGLYITANDMSDAYLTKEYVDNNMVISNDKINELFISSNITP